MKTPKIKTTAAQIAVVGIMTATLTLGKLALSWLPNIEVVTLLICVYSAVFGRRLAFLAAVSFVVVEGFLYGFMSSWFVSYLLYFPALPFLVWLPIKLAGKVPRGKMFIYALFGFLFTMCFDVLTVAMDTFFYGATFYIRFLSGIVFFIVHSAGNFAMFLVGFIPLEKVLSRIKKGLAL